MITNVPSIPTNDEASNLTTSQTQDLLPCPVANHIYNPTTGQRETIDTLLAGTNIGKQALSYELGRLAKGLDNRVQFTDAIEFIHRHEVPVGSKVTYANLVCDYRPLKSESNRVRITVGGDRIPYSQDAGSPAVTLIEAKLLINSTISDSANGARFLAADIKDFVLSSPMTKPEYMRIHSKYFFEDISRQYNIQQKIASDGFVYIKIKKGMYGLKQTAILAYQNLVKNMKPFGYFPCPSTTGLWRHKDRRTKFCLCTDDFGVKYNTDNDKQHFLDAFKTCYTISVNEEGKNYLGLQLEWNYQNGYVDIFMPTYISKLLSRLKHPNPLRPQHTPHRWTQPAYGNQI